MQMIEQDGRGLSSTSSRKAAASASSTKSAPTRFRTRALTRSRRMSNSGSPSTYAITASVQRYFSISDSAGVKVISNNPLKLRALEEAGLKIVERVSIEVDATEDAAGYLRTKKKSSVTC